MNRLDYSRKFVVQGLLFAAAAAVLLVELVSQLTATLDKLSAERQGNGLVVSMSVAIRDIQQHRGMSAAVLGGEARMNAARAAKELEVVSNLEQMAVGLRLSRLPAEELALTQTKWDAIRMGGLRLSVAESFQAHSDLIALMLNQIVTVADLYGLQLDDDVATYHLINVAVNKVPSLLERLGKIRGHGSGMIAAHDVSEAQQFRLLYLIADFQSTLNSMQNHLARARQHNPVYNARLARAEEQIDKAAADFAHVTNQEMLSKVLGLTPADYFHRVTLSIDIIYAELFDTFHPVVDLMLHDRYHHAMQKAWMTLGAAFLLLLVMGYFAWGPTWPRCATSGIWWSHCRRLPEGICANGCNLPRAMKWARLAITSTPWQMRLKV